MFFETLLLCPLCVVNEHLGHFQIFYSECSSDRRSSRASSLSPSFSQGTPPEMRTRPKRKNIIKNIQPHTFKRPSSFNLKEAEAAALSAKTPKDVTLVGYRKTMASPNVHSRVIENSLELGTLSPASSSDQSSNLRNMSNSVSLPLLERSDWSRNSDGTLPEYMQVARRSLRAKKRQRNNKLITVDFGGSDPDISFGKGAEDSEPRRLKRAHTDPARRSKEVRKIYTPSSCNPDQSESSINAGTHTTAIGVQEAVAMTTATSESSNHGKTAGSDVDVKQKLEQDSSMAKKQLNFQDELYKNLSDCLTKALGDAELHDSDKSDDETCVQNGFDECLEGSGVQGNDTEREQRQLSPARNNHSTPAKHGNRSSVSDNNGQSSDRQQAGLTVRDILKNNMLQLTSHDEKSGRDSGLLVLNGSLSSLGSEGKPEEDQSVSRIAVTKESETVSDTGDLSYTSKLSDDQAASSSRECSAGTRDSGVVLVGSQSDLASKSSSTVEIITDKDTDSERDGEQVTVIELLREEYKRNSVVGQELNQSISEFSDSGVSGVSVSVKTHKASSDSNILQSVETSNVSDSYLDVKKHNDVMSTSASFPDISKLAQSPKDSPRLVNKVGHSTVK